MKIDPKTLAILGPCKEGFEWVEMEASSLGVEVADGDALITAQGKAWHVFDTNILNSRGIAIGTGKFYRQVPIEPEPEVIHTWEAGAPLRFILKPQQPRQRPMARMEMYYPVKGWQAEEWQDNWAVGVASMGAALKKAREQLREIKKKASRASSPEYMRDRAYVQTAELIDACLALEVE